ncbi:hypothetical protein I5M32_07150 [Pedobacter sp. SD-b]|uniref:Uncharacterized protein n=1 Tax=Pedobacter segetis TaxID=2793069 RepID=A0ABS1BIM0_9SPHI|nr:hypothetical protein [Pedobacter segetis]MBK0382732.1 hypothetical protein [Pedobacter segetis]
MVNANNPSHYKIIILGVFIGLFGIYVKQFVYHSMLVDMIGWAITIIGAAIAISGVMRVLKD